MTGVERLYAVWEAARHVVDRDVPGDVVECGVWRGGSSMMAALAIQERGARRDLWLFDTYEGMPPPGELDVSYRGVHAGSELRSARRQAGVESVWAYATLDDVRANLLSTGYPLEHLHFVPGKVEDTIPLRAPDRIALLRLDTDWYESTRHELEYLYGRLEPGGVLIIDDYGHWAGARRAVDEFFSTLATPPMLHRIDYTGRIAVKH